MVGLIRGLACDQLDKANFLAFSKALTVREISSFVVAQEQMLMRMVFFPFH